MSASRAVALIALTMATAAQPAAGQDTRPEGRQSTREAGALSIESLAFLTGCWAGTWGEIELREQWSDAEDGVMLGTSRFFRDGDLVDFEFGRIEQDEHGVTIWPYPRGRISENGFPLVSAGTEVVFENLAHDFPVRIIYERVGPDHLKPRIEGSDGTGPGWELRRTPCPTS